MFPLSAVDSPLAQSFTSINQQHHHAIRFRFLNKKKGGSLDHPRQDKKRKKKIELGTIVVTNKRLALA
jgi:hypothetical protein